MCHAMSASRSRSNSGTGTRNSGGSGSSRERFSGTATGWADEWSPVRQAGLGFSGGIQWPSVLRDGGDGSHGVKASGCSFANDRRGGGGWTTGEPYARFPVREYAEGDVAGETSSYFFNENEGKQVEDRRRVGKQAEKMQRRLASSYRQFVPKCVLENQTVEALVPAGNVLSVCWDDAYRDRPRLLAFFPRSPSGTELGLCSIDVRGAEVGRPSRAYTAKLDLKSAIHQVHAVDYRPKFPETGGLLYAARSDGHVYCGKASNSEEGGVPSVALENLFDLSLSGSAHPSHVCLSHHWPELSFGTCCGKVCAVDLERAGGQSSEESTWERRAGALRDAASRETFQLRTEAPVFQVYGEHPKTLICCSASSLLRADLRMPTGERIYSSAQSSEYRAIERLGSHLLAVASRDTVALFDERYMQPVQAWEAPQGCRLVCGALGAQGEASASCCEVDGLILASGDNLAEGLCHPFSASGIDSDPASLEFSPALALNPPASAAHGPGLSLRHSGGAPASSSAAINRLEVLGFPDLYSREADPLRLPREHDVSPIKCVGLGALAAWRDGRFLLCSLASDFGITLSWANSRPADEGDVKERGQRLVDGAACNAAAHVGRGGRTDSSGDVEYADLRCARAFVSDVSAYSDPRALARAVDAHRQTSFGSYPSTAYEILLNRVVSSGREGGAGSEIGVRRPHRSLFRAKYGDEGSGPVAAMEVLSTVLELDADSVLPPASASEEAGPVQRELRMRWGADGGQRVPPPQNRA